MNVEHLRRAARLGDDTALRPERFGALAYDFDTRRLSFVRRRSQARGALNEEFERGLDAPICLTWELTYACNLACVHCLSSSGRRDPRELTDRRVQGGDRRARADAGLLREHRRRRADGPQGLLGARRVRDRAQGRREVLHQRQPHHRRARGVAGGERLRRRADLARRRDRGGQRPRARRGLLRHRDRGHAAPARGGDARTSSSRSSSRARTSASSTRSRRSPTRYGAQLRITRLRPSGRGADVWDELHPTPRQQRELYDWLAARGEKVLTGDSFFHLAPLGDGLPGLNLCGAGRVVCLIDPIGDVYACPFAIHDEFLAGNVREPRGFAGVWRSSELFLRAAQAAERRRLRVLLVLRLVPRRLHGGEVLHRAAARRSRPRVRARAR